MIMNNIRESLKLNTAEGQQVWDILNTNLRMGWVKLDDGLNFYADHRLAFNKTSSCPYRQKELPSIGQLLYLASEEGFNQSCGFLWYPDEDYDYTATRCVNDFNGQYYIEFATDVDLEVEFYKAFDITKEQYLAVNYVLPTFANWDEQEFYFECQPSNIQQLYKHWFSKSILPKRGQTDDIVSLFVTHNRDERVLKFFADSIRYSMDHNCFELSNGWSNHETYLKIHDVKDMTLLYRSEFQTTSNEIYMSHPLKFTNNMTPLHSITSLSHSGNMLIGEGENGQTIYGFKTQNLEVISDTDTHYGNVKVYQGGVQWCKKVKADRVVINTYECRPITFDVWINDKVVDEIKHGGI